MAQFGDQLCIFANWEVAALYAFNPANIGMGLKRTGYKMHDFLFDGLAGNQKTYIGPALGKLLNACPSALENPWVHYWAYSLDETGREPRTGMAYPAPTCLNGNRTAPEPTLPPEKPDSNKNPVPGA
ncbi:MAG: hypothetical protein M3O22_06355 [Pseudomonadota bacterium]|nr:hypothetical protein [Pseudomonadota bacterium]